MASRHECGRAVSCAELLTSSRDWLASATTRYESHPSSETPSAVISRDTSVAFARCAESRSSCTVRASAAATHREDVQNSTIVIIHNEGLSMHVVCAWRAEGGVGGAAPEALALSAHTRHGRGSCSVIPQGCGAPGLLRTLTNYKRHLGHAEAR